MQHKNERLPKKTKNKNERPIRYLILQCGVLIAMMTLDVPRSYAKMEKQEVGVDFFSFLCFTHGSVVEGNFPAHFLCLFPAFQTATKD